MRLRHHADPLDPPPRRRDDLQAEAVLGYHVPRLRYLPEPRVEQSTERIEAIGVDLGVELLVELIDGHPRVHHGFARGTALDDRLVRIELVLYLADDLLEEVLDRHDTGDAAVLVDDDRDVHAPVLELREHLVDALALRHEECGAHQVAQG